MSGSLSPPFGLGLEAQAPRTLGEALKLYELIYMPSRNFAARTRLDYHNDLEDLIAFLEKGSLRRLNQFSLRDLEAYLAELDRRGYAGASRKQDLRHQVVLQLPIPLRLH